MSVKLIAEDKEPLLLVVESEPKLELELTDNVEADKVRNWDSKEAIVWSASRSPDNKTCFSSWSLNI